MSNLVPLQMASAEVTLGHELDGWSLHEPEGSPTRSFEHTIEFAQPFAASPVVHVGLIGFDVSNDSAARVRVGVVATTSQGFTIRVETWLQTRVWSVVISWLAVGS